MSVESFVPLNAVWITLVIIIAGVGLRTWSGVIGKSVKEINPNLMIFTFLLSCITGIGIVVPHVETVLATENITSSEILLLVGNQILTVFGADALYKSKKVQQIKERFKKSE